MVRAVTIPMKSFLFTFQMFLTNSEKMWGKTDNFSLCTADIFHLTVLPVWGRDLWCLELTQFKTLLKCLCYSNADFAYTLSKRQFIMDVFFIQTRKVHADNSMYIVTSVRHVCLTPSDTMGGHGSTYGKRDMYVFIAHAHTRHTQEFLQRCNTLCRKLITCRMEKSKIKYCQFSLYMNLLSTPWLCKEQNCQPTLIICSSILVFH